MSWTLASRGTAANGPTWWESVRRTATCVVVLALVVAIPSGRARAASYVAISGAGSTWSSNALSQWASNVKMFGMTVNYQASGSTDGRNQFKQKTVDFAVSEIPYGLNDQ